MKIRTTRKAVVEQSTKIVSIGYCAAQTLLQHHQPIAYTCGVYGWNFDVYEIDGVTICTGYRGTPGKTEWHVTREYETRARAIMDDYEHPYEDRAADVERLLHEWLEEVC